MGFDLGDRCADFDGRRRRIRWKGPRNSTPDRGGFMPISSAAIDDHNLRTPGLYRLSNDSGQGTERNTESLRSRSISSTEDENPSPVLSRRNTDEEVEEEKHGLLCGSRVDRFLSRRILGLFSSRLLYVFHFLYDAVDRVILILGFIALSSGFVTYGGLFVSIGFIYWTRKSLIINREEEGSSADLLISSKAEFSSGMGS